MNGRDILDLGFKRGPIINKILVIFQESYSVEDETSVIEFLKGLLIDPYPEAENETWKEVVEILIADLKSNEVIKVLDNHVPYSIYGKDNIEAEALTQMEMATKLPISIRGALMPDAHAGYGLPIGGVLATKDAIIPYGVGNDIGCRMHLSIFDLDKKFIKGRTDQLVNILQRETKFGTGQEFEKFGEHEILDNNNFNLLKILRENKDRASKQLGTSGSGNHFVEFGIVEIFEDFEYDNAIQPAGEYFAVLSHSGSRGLGNNIASHYTRIAKERCFSLPKEYRHLSWLDMNSEVGQEYWLAMNIAGDYAQANHEIIHKKIYNALGERPFVVIQNHHNFAWKEMYNGEELIVHRKGATPAGVNTFGIIPGNMADAGYIVRGLGNDESLNSASHGAGRQMSRTKAKEKYTMTQLKNHLETKGVLLVGGDTDESPGAYKPIEEVMNQQRELVLPLGKFQPKIVRMADR